MMLIERNQVEAQLLGITILVDVVVVIVGCLFGVEKPVGYGKEGVILQDLFFRQPSIGTLSKISNFHFCFSGSYGAATP
jgi:hypothetical protein